MKDLHQQPMEGTLINYLHTAFLRVVLLLIFLSLPLLSYGLNRKQGMARLSPQELFDSAGYFLEKRNSPDSALLYLTALTTIAESDPEFHFDSEIYPVAYQTMGVIYASVYGNYSEAAVNMLKGLKLVRQQNLDLWENRITFNLSAMEYEQGRLSGNDTIVETSLEKFQSLLNKTDISGDRGLAMTLLMNIAELGIREGMPEKVSAACSSLSVGDSTGSPLKILGKISSLLSERKYGEACQMMDSTVRNIHESQSYLTTSIHNGLFLLRAHILLEAGKETEALQAYDEVIEMNEKAQDLFSIFEIYSHLRKYYKMQGDPQKATEYERAELRTKDRLVNRSRSLSFDLSRSKYNEEQLKQEMGAEISRSRTYQIVLWVSLFFLAILIILLVLLYAKLRQLKKSRQIIVRNDQEFFLNALDKSKSDNQDKESANSVSDTSTLYEKILNVVKSNDEIYEEDFNTSRLAELLEEKPRKVSAAILESTGESVTQFIARIRIREACRRINDKVNYGGYTIEAIGQSVGYRSRSHFGVVFKKIIGMTPSEYISNLKGINQKE